MPQIAPNRVTKPAAKPIKPGKPTALPSKHSKLSQSLQATTERARSAIAAINKTKYEDDRRLFSAGQKEAARMRAEDAQRAALDEDLRMQARDQAIIEIKAAETDNVIASLRNEFRPKIIQEIRKEVYRKVYSEVKDELRETLAEQVRADLRSELKRSVIRDLQRALKDEVISQLQDALYDEVIESLKEEYREEVIGDLREELREEVAAKMQTNGTMSENGDEKDGENYVNMDEFGEQQAHDTKDMSPKSPVILPENGDQLPELFLTNTRSKRRASFSFEPVNEDGLRKKPRLAKSDSGRPSTSDGLPAFGTFAMYDPKRPKQAKIDEADEEDDEQSQDATKNAKNEEYSEEEGNGGTEGEEDGDDEGEENFDEDLDEDFGEDYEEDFEDEAGNEDAEEEENVLEAVAKKANGYYDDEAQEEAEYEEEEEESLEDGVRNGAEDADDDDDEEETPYHSALQEPDAPHPYYAASASRKKSKSYGSLYHQPLYQEDDAIDGYGSDEDEEEEGRGEQPAQFQEKVEYVEFGEEEEEDFDGIKRTTRHAAYSLANYDDGGYEEYGDYDEEYESGLTTSGMGSGAVSGNAGSPSSGFAHGPGATQEDPIEIDLD